MAPKNKKQNKKGNQNKNPNQQSLKVEEPEQSNNDQTKVQVHPNDVQLNLASTEPPKIEQVQSNRDQQEPTNIPNQDESPLPVHNQPSIHQAQLAEQQITNQHTQKTLQNQSVSQVDLSFHPEQAVSSFSSNEKVEQNLVSQPNAENNQTIIESEKTKVLEPNEPEIIREEEPSNQIRIDQVDQSRLELEKNEVQVESERLKSEVQVESERMESEIVEEVKKAEGEIEVVRDIELVQQTKVQVIEGEATGEIAIEIQNDDMAKEKVEVEVEREIAAQIPVQSNQPQIQVQEQVQGQAFFNQIQPQFQRKDQQENQVRPEEKSISVINLNNSETQIKPAQLQQNEILAQDQTIQLNEHLESQNLSNQHAQSEGIVKQIESNHHHHQIDPERVFTMVESEEISMSQSNELSAQNSVVIGQINASHTQNAIIEVSSSFSDLNNSYLSNPIETHILQHEIQKIEVQEQQQSSAFHQEPVNEKVEEIKIEPNVDSEQHVPLIQSYIIEEEELKKQEVEKEIENERIRKEDQLRKEEMFKEEQRLRMERLKEVERQREIQKEKLIKREKEWEKQRETQRQRQKQEEKALQKIKEDVEKEERKVEKEKLEVELKERKQVQKDIGSESFVQKASIAVAIGGAVGGLVYKLSTGNKEAAGIAGLIAVGLSLIVQN